VTFIHNKIEYTKLQSTEEDIIYTDNSNLFQVNINTRIGLKCTGKSLSEIYKLSSGFNPTKFTVEDELIQTLKTAINGSSYIRKAYKLSSGEYAFVKNSNRHTDDYVDCLVVRDDIKPYTGEAIKNKLTEDKEVSMAEFMKVLKQSLTFLIEDELIIDDLFKE
jgi:hypothetical protein